MIAAVARTAGRVSTARIEAALRERNLEALNRIAFEIGEKVRKELASRMGSALLEKVIAAGRSAGHRAKLDKSYFRTAQRSIRSAQVTLAFDVTNPLASRWARERSSALVTEISTETREAIRDIMERSFTEQFPPREAARLIKHSVGLTSAHANAVMNYAAELADEGYSRDEIRDLTDDYADELLDYRAMNIARTETIASENEGERELWVQARDEGLLTGAELREWIITPDERLCPICSAMEGQTRGIDEPFETPEGELVMGPPAHPQCRCAQGLTLPSAELAAAAQWNEEDHPRDDAGKFTDGGGAGGADSEPDLEQIRTWSEGGGVHGDKYVRMRDPATEEGNSFHNEIAKLPDYRGTVYRGMALTRDQLNSIISRGEVEFDLSSSTSKDKGVALDFAQIGVDIGASDSETVGVLFEMSVESGKDISAVTAKAIGDFDMGQDEVVVIAGTRYERPYPPNKFKMPDGGTAYRIFLREKSRSKKIKTGQSFRVCVIRKVGDEWCLYTHDGSKKLGCHDTKSDAEAQERAIQVSKHSTARALRLFLRDLAEWNEADHPRDDVGKFTDGGGTDSGSADDADGDSESSESVAAKIPRMADDEQYNAARERWDSLDKDMLAISSEARALRRENWERAAATDPEQSDRAAAEIAKIDAIDSAIRELGPDFFAEHAMRDDDFYHAKMEEVQEAWKHIGGPGPTDVRFAAERAFGLESAPTWDAKQGKFVDTPDDEARVIQWAGAMRREYAETQADLDEGVELSARLDRDEAYEEWIGTSDYRDGYAEALYDAWGSLGSHDKAEYIRVLGEHSYKDDTVDVLNHAVSSDALEDADFTSAIVEELDSAGSRDFQWGDSEEEQIGRFAEEASKLKTAVSEELARHKDEKTAFGKKFAGTYSDNVSNAEWRSERERIADTHTQNVRKIYGEDFAHMQGPVYVAARHYVTASDEGMQTGFERYSENWTWDDEDDHFNEWWSSSEEAGEGVEIDRGTLMNMELHRGIREKTEVYVASAVESWSVSKGVAESFGYHVMSETIDSRRILVFQGSRNWKAQTAGSMGLTEQEFMVLASTPAWVESEHPRNEEGKFIGVPG